MAGLDWSLIALIAAISLACGAALLIVAHWIESRWPARSMALRRDTDRSACFLFDNDILVDATPHALQLLSACPPAEDDWARLHANLSQTFPDFPETLHAAAREPYTTLAPRHSSDPRRLEVESWDGMVRVSLVLGNGTRSDGQDQDFAGLSRLQHEVEVLRQAVSASPNPIWQTDGTGKVVWSNTAFQALYRKLRPDDSKDRDAPLFSVDPQSSDLPRTQRFNLRGKEADISMWFDVTSTRSGDDMMHFASDVNAVVKAEMAQRNFVQTLTKTFAHLSIGLAIFDRNRQLALFNPALIDLTQLPADFLSARPNLLTFFDRLRDNQMMPEPKNYSSWRERIADLVAAASDGRYSEIWTLHSGLTYRVTGRPHPDGAIAFLIEDISAEISLTRRFRSEMELGQSVLDTLDEAVAVFSSVGVLTLSNRAYRAMWKVDPDGAFADTTILDATRQWQGQCLSSPVWGDLRDFVVAFGERAEWEADVTRLSGEVLRCRFVPLGGGATMVGFSPNDRDSHQLLPTNDPAAAGIR